MLILSRRPSESLVIEQPNGEVIRVNVLSIKGNQVRLGVEAQRETIVDREEIYERRVADRIKEAS